MSRKLSLLCSVQLIVYIIILSSSILTATGQLSNIVAKSRNILSADGDVAPTNGEATLNSREENEEDDPEKFSWKNHQDDHSIYAHRSLMSAANIKRPLPDGVGASDEEDEVGAKRPGDIDEELAPLKTVDFAEKEWQLMFRSFDLMFDGLSSSLVQELGQRTNLLNEIISRLKPECRRDIEHIRRSIKQHKLWALKMVDSIGKLSSGITYGKFSSPGDYEECLSVRVNEQVYTPIRSSDQQVSAGKLRQQTDGKQNSASSSLEHYKFHGKYCLIDFRLPLPERPKDKLLSIHDPVIDLAKTEVGKQYPDLANYSGYASVFYEVGYMHAVCLPSTCQVSDLTRSLGKALEGLHIVVNNTIDCEERFDERPAWRTSQVIATTLLVILFVNATFATAMRYIAHRQSVKKKKKSQEDDLDGRKSASGWKEWATDMSVKSKIYSDCFSIQSNFERLSKPDPRGLTFVHYTRIVAMALTVITHTAGLGTLQAITKPADASNSEQIFRDFIPQMLANAFTSIQIFFFMAGFMLVISTYPSINREKGHVSFLEYAIKRAIRLMPGLAATICINFLWPLLVDGPMLSYFVRLIVVPCEANWWRTMLFLSNFDHVEKMCLRHSYFSASDYQLHLLAFPLLILLYKQPNLSLIIAGLLTCAGFVAQVIMILTKTVLPFMMVDYIDKEAFFNVVHYIHHPSWNHMSAFFYGFIIGYLVVKQIRIELSKKTVRWLSCTILPIGLISIFAPYFWNHYKRPIYRWQMVLYVLFDRFALLTACAWLSYATMVLGREPAAKKTPTKPDRSRPEVGEKMNTGKFNLPSIVTLSSATPLGKISDGSPVATDNQQQSQKFDHTWTTNPTAPEKLRSSTTSLSTNLTRQRSSPNFQAYKQQDNQSAPTTPTLRPAISSSNVHSEMAARDHEAAGRQVKSYEAPNGSDRQTSGQPAVSPKTISPAQRKSQGPVSNLNTLCLVLSRLTFQLYLFNMVVLWIDVNHSKYYWFFSYYFIITKALAIYICSSLLALVFFVTLESPSLTLYIMWVKSRAQSRADRGAAGEAQSKRDEKSQNKGTINVLRDPDQITGPAPYGLPMHGQSYLSARDGNDQLSGSSDGLDMRIGSPIRGAVGITKPTFSYIDLSSPSEASHDAKITNTSSFTGEVRANTLQTKM